MACVGGPSPPPAAGTGSLIRVGSNSGSLMPERYPSPRAHDCDPRPRDGQRAQERGRSYKPRERVGGRRLVGAHDEASLGVVAHDVPLLGHRARRARRAAWPPVARRRAGARSPRASTWRGAPRGHGCRTAGPSPIGVAPRRCPHPGRGWRTRRRRGGPAASSTSPPGSSRRMSGIVRPYPSYARVGDPRAAPSRRPARRSGRGWGCCRPSPPCSCGAPPPSSSSRSRTSTAWPSAPSGSGSARS